MRGRRLAVHITTVPLADGRKKGLWRCRWTAAVDATLTGRSRVEEACVLSLALVE